MPIGTITAKNIGVEMLITTNTDMTYTFFVDKRIRIVLQTKAQINLTEKNIKIAKRKINGIILSTTSTSFENRFTTRPKGVVSKNDIGNLNVCFSKLLCKSRAAFTHPIAIAIAVPSTETAVRKNY